MSGRVLSWLLCAFLGQAAVCAPPASTQSVQAGEEELSAVEQMLARIIDRNKALARRVKADATVLKAVQQAEFALGQDSSTGTAKALAALEETEETSAAASPETVTLLRRARALVEEASRQPQARRSVQETFHHAVTDRMLEVVRGNNIALFDRLLQLRRLQQFVDTTIEYLERATFEELKASTP